MQNRIGTLRPRVARGTPALRRRSQPSERRRAGQPPWLPVCLPCCTLGSETLPAEPGFSAGSAAASASLLSGSLQHQAGSQMPTGKLLKTAPVAEGG